MAGSLPAWSLWAGCVPWLKVVNPVWWPKMSQVLRTPSTVVPWALHQPGVVLSLPHLSDGPSAISSLDLIGLERALCPPPRLSAACLRPHPPLPQPPRLMDNHARALEGHFQVAPWRPLGLWGPHPGVPPPAPAPSHSMARPPSRDRDGILPPWLWGRQSALPTENGGL